MKKAALLLIMFLRSILLLPGSADPTAFSDQVLDDKIKTVQLYREEWNLSYPVIKLNSSEKLVFQFDLLDDHIETYYYTFIHCNKEWERSDIFVNDYMTGFDENPIEEYNTSFNTTVNYVHYKLTFPNDRVNLKLSGNYILSVYPSGSPERPVITRRFMITEDAAGITIDMHRPRMTSESNTSQQVDFVVRYPGSAITDPFNNIYAFILQNGRWNNAKRNLKPDFFGNNELKYNALSEKNIFRGGNEFRYFDIKSIRYQSEYVKRIDYLVPGYHVYLYPSENREFKPYFYWQDFNGKYYIAFQEGRNPETDADYVYVYFTLPSKNPLTGGKLYVAGGFNNWSFDKNNLMFYNPDNEAYECIILLKQGWYNYEYVFLGDGMTDGTASKFEGSHYETENDYTVLIYYRNPRDRYDRLLGASTANTLNSLSD